MSDDTKTALSPEDISVSEKTHDMVYFPNGGRGVDLSAFPECEEYMYSSMTMGEVWQRFYIEGIKSRFQTRVDEERFKTMYKEYYQNTFSNRAIYYMCLMLLVIFFYSWFSFPFVDIFFTASLERSLRYYKDTLFGIYPLAISFVFIKYTQYKLWNDTDTESGYFFNRLNGRVERRLSDGTVSLPFNEFRPIAVQERGPNGHTATRLMIYHDQMNLALPVPSLCLADAIVCWSYLKQFMDLERPLPDIPEHEETRHLDPTTKRHDEEQGRDPYYWRKKSAADIKAIQEEARKRVKAQFNDSVYFY